jgi:hypothetical protein
MFEMALAMAEMVFAVIAWRKGWLGLALLPIGFAGLMDVLRVLMYAPMGAMILPNLIAFIVLGDMIAHPRHTLASEEAEWNF